MISFHDKADAEAHAKFQTFRREHPNAFVLNMRASRTGMFHLCVCDHLGDTEWTKEDGGSLTSSEKICSEAKEELVAYAQRHDIGTHDCQTCKP